MLTIRSVQWPEDVPSLVAFDTAYDTDRIYRVTQTDLSFVLDEIAVEPPLHKVYPLTDVAAELQKMDYAVVAELEQAVVGFAAVQDEAWNRRAVVWHLYVAPQHRGSGIGRRLLHTVEEFACSTGARCLWLETQNINDAAIQFYRRTGFRFCGLDASLYDPQSSAGREVALFFVRELEKTVPA